MKKSGNSSNKEFAVFMPLNAKQYILQYPAGAGANSMYFEAQSLQVRDRVLLQLHGLGSFEEGVAKPDAKLYTLLWLQEQKKSGPLEVRALNGDVAKTMTPEQLRAKLKDASTDWKLLFGEPMQFQRLR